MSKKADTLAHQLKTIRRQIAESDRRIDELRGRRERTPKHVRRDLERDISREEGLRAGLGTMLDALEGQAADAWAAFRKKQREAISASSQTMKELSAIAGEIDVKLADISALYADFDERAKSLQPLFPHEESSAKRWMNSNDFMAACVAQGIGHLFGASGRGHTLSGKIQTFSIREIQAAASRAAEELNLVEEEDEAA